MRTSRLERIAACLCLVLAIASGLVPTQAFVLCIEPDGRVSLEAVDPAGTCGGCLPGTDSGAAATSAVPGLEVACPCVDLTLAVASQDTRLLAKRVELPDNAWTPLPALSIRHRPWHHARSDESSARTPRASDSLARIRTVVLLV
jgi:hypothetical protein